MSRDPSRAGESQLPPHLREGLAERPAPPAPPVPPAPPTASGPAPAAHGALTDHPDRMLPCACPCGCGNATDVPARLAVPSVAARVRCEPCHDAGHPRPPAPPLAPVQARRTIARREPSAADRELDRQVAAESVELRWQEWTEAWRERLPAKFRQARTDEPMVLDRLDRIRRGQPGGLLVLGLFGRGKTWRALSLANMAVEQRLLKPAQIVFGSEADLFGPIVTASFGDQEAMFARLMDKQVRMLLIDDVGRGYYPGGPEMQELSRTGLFQRVLDACWRDAKYVVITTNLPANDLLAYVGKAGYERLVDSVGGTPLWVHGEDVRRELREKREKEWEESVRAVRPADRDPFA